MSFNHILKESKDHVGIITLNRSEALNALCAELMDEVGRAIATFEADDTIGCLILKGSEKAVAAGADIKEMVDKTYIEAFGNPVTFYQMQDSGKPVKGHAQKVRYDVASQLVTLTGNAYLEQLDSNVKGDRITYLVQQQQMQAFSDKGKRVTTVLVPSQLQDKNGQKKSN